LLQHFGGAEGIKNATLAELCQVEGINKKTAKEILRVLVG
jgi:excinuclease UvrABC nuclease subunit